MNTQQNASQAPTEAAPSSAKSIEQRMSEMENNNTRMLTLMEAMNDAARFRSERRDRGQVQLAA